MNSFEVNKIVSAILIALLAAMIFSLIGNELVAPKKKLAKNVYIVDVSLTDSAGAGSQPTEKVFQPIGPLLEKANPENGEKIFKQCGQCHYIEKNKNNIGPSLWGVVGRAIASISDFSYSSAIKEKAGEKWHEENLNHFLYKPREFIKGTKMSFMGLEKDQDRADVISYLKKMSAS